MVRLELKYFRISFVRFAYKFICVFIEEMIVIEKLRSEKNLHSILTRYIVQLYGYEVVIVCDDSGSMITPVDETRKTRWDELCTIVKRILDITVMFDSTGVDLYFLNGGEYPKIKDPADVDHAFARTPRGFTPLVPVLKQIFQSKMAARGRDKKVLVFVATDGKPTNDDGDEIVEELEHLMRYTRDKETTFVSFLLCTDEQQCVDYLERWDRTMENVDVTDDYETELRKIRQCQEDENYRFSYDDYIVKALIGSMVPHIDRLNEQKIQRTTSTVNT